MDGEEYNKMFQYINEGTYSIEGKNTLNIRRIHKYTYDCKLKTFREMLLTTLEHNQHDVIDVI